MQRAVQVIQTDASAGVATLKIDMHAGYTHDMNYIDIPGNTPAAKAARQALAVGSTRAGGSVLGAAREYVRQPEGGWPQTCQAWGRFVDAVDLATRVDRDVGRDATRLIAVALRRN